MMTVLRQAGAICVVLVTGAAVAPGLGWAQSPIDVPTLATIAPPDEAPAANAPRSSFDYETAAVPRPWDLPRTPATAQPGTLAAAAPAPAPARPTAFTGAATPLACRQPAYRIIFDERSDMKAGTLCVLPDGSWRL